MKIEYTNLLEATSPPISLPTCGHITGADGRVLGDSPIDSDELTLDIDGGTDMVSLLYPFNGFYFGNFHYSML